MDNPEENYLEPVGDDLHPVLAMDELPTEAEAWSEDEVVIEEVDETADMAEDDHAVENPEESEAPANPAKPLVIFISHRQLPGLDQDIASMLYRELSDPKLSDELNIGSVYLDTAQLPASRYAEAIQGAIESANFVIALITTEANRPDSDWISYELRLAHQRWKRFRKPIIIPVDLEPIESYGAHIGPYVGGFHRIVYTGDNAALIASIRDTISGDDRQAPDPGGLDRFLVSDWQRDRARTALLSAETVDATAFLEKDKLLWITGDASVRNYFALSLAIRLQAVPVGAGPEGSATRKIYEVPKSLRWSKVHNTLISDSIIIFNDVDPGNIFDEESQNNELRFLELMINRNNIVIVTTSANSFLEIKQEMRKQEFRRGQTLQINADFYSQPDKLAIFDKLLDFSQETGDINSNQLEWARRSEVRERLASTITKWSPADIERFITWHLPQVNGFGDILKLLQRNVDLDNEIHAWFTSLDDSTRCFVMVLALFAELNRQQFWGKYKEIVGRLRQLDGRLSLWPLGISRERAALYVTTEGPVNFREERIAEAIHREIARNYREYFIELLPLMEEWSVPAGRDGNRAGAEARKRQAAKSQASRDAIAHMVGKMGQYGLHDLRGLITRWATDPMLKVRDAVARALEQATAENAGQKQVFNILDDWCRDRLVTRDALSRIWAAASALGTIAAANPDRQIAKEALRRLAGLAQDTRPSIRFYVSIPLKRAARKVALNDEIENLLRLVIQDGRASTRLNVAEALYEARVFDEAIGLNVLNRWLASDDVNERWAATCSLILGFFWRKSTDHDYQELFAFLRADAETMISIFVELVDHKYHKRKAQSVFTQLVLNVPDEMSETLISGMAKISFAVVYEKLLTRLKAFGKPVFDALVVDVRRESWRQLLSTPQKFTEDLEAELNSGHVSPEVYRALIELLQPEPEGWKRQATAALAHSFPEYRASLDRLLRKLRELAPSALESFSADVRREAFRRLFHVPDVFVETVAEYFADNNTVTEARGAIEMLAQPEPEGYREELLEALASGYALNENATRNLLAQFRLSPGSTLRWLAHEFTLRFFEGTLSDPAALYLNLVKATTNPYELTDVVQALKGLAVSEPLGQRKTLVRALAQTRISQPGDMDNLLQHPALLSEPELAGLRLEVKLASVLNRVFVPRFLTKLFTPR